MTAATSAPRLPSPAAQPRLDPRVVLAAIAAGAVAAVALWLVDTPPTLHGFGDWFTNAGRITGLLAGYAIVVQLALMARIPALDASLGTDRLARWHAFGGRYTISLATAHTVLVIWGYAISAHTDVVHQTGTLLTSYPDVLMATVALGLFLLVAAVSARAARSRLRYETWYYLHFYTYLAIALAFAHTFATGAEFVSNRPARVFWALLYIAAAALLVWYRFAVPIRRFARHRLTVRGVKRETPDTISITIGGRHLPELQAAPGQFFRWRFLTRDGWWQSHPFSLSAGPRPDLLRITVKSLGDYSASLAGLRRGTPVLAEGPYGALTAARRTRRGVLLLAGGVGITPLRALFATLDGGPGDLVLLYRAERAQDVLFRGELDEIARRRDGAVRYLIGPPGSAADVFLGDRLRQAVPDVARRDVFVCGPPGFTDAATAAVRRAGVPAACLHVEQFAF